jgi:hypothetical protein
MNIGNMLVLIGVSFALAFLTESLVEYLVGTPLAKIPKLAKFAWLLIYVSAIAGVGLALYWHIDLIAVIANWIAKVADTETEWNVTTVGQVLSGLAIGRGANYLHDFLTRYLKKPDVTP